MGWYAHIMCKPGGQKIQFPYSHWKAGSSSNTWLVLSLNMNQTDNYLGFPKLLLAKVIIVLSITWLLLQFIVGKKGRKEEGDKDDNHASWWEMFGKNKM
jgi:hypothetical protein